MALFPETLFDFPNVSAYDSDLREIIAMLRGLTDEMRNFKVINKITNAGAWDITKQYKPWTIVSNDNIGYISVRPVPAGIEITNTDYWALVADYDILITNLSERISALEKDVSKLKNRFFVFIGDSYSVGTSGGVPETNFGWIDQIVKMLGLNAEQYVRATLTELGNLASFWPTTSSHRSWRDSIELVYNRMTDAQKEKVNDVVCCGGYNETFGGSEALTKQGMIDYINYVKTVFPNATYWLGEIGMNTGMNAANITARNFILDTVIPLYHSASRFGFTVMCGTDSILWNNTQTTDTIHPDEANYELIGTAIANNLLYMPSPSFNANWFGSLPITLAAGLSFHGSSPTALEIGRMPNGIFTVKCNDYLLIDIATPTLLYPVTEFTLGTYDPTYFVTGYGTVVIDVPVIMGQSNSAYASGCASLIFDNGALKFRSNTNTAGVQTSSIQIGRFTEYVHRPLVL